MLDLRGMQESPCPPTREEDDLPLFDWEGQPMLVQEVFPLRCLQEAPNGVHVEALVGHMMQINGHRPRILRKNG